MKRYKILKEMNTATLLLLIEQAKKLSEISGRNVEDYLSDYQLDLIYNGKLYGNSDAMNSYIIIEEEAQ